jgi:membrane-bound lytic murein transglycosylase B
MRPPQLLPAKFLRYGVNGEGQREIFRPIPYALATLANDLREHEWTDIKAGPAKYAFLQNVSCTPRAMAGQGGTGVGTARSDSHQQRLSA